MIEPSDEHRKFMAFAYAEAKTGFEEGGLPIGAVISVSGVSMSSLVSGRSRVTS